MRNLDHLAVSYHGTEPSLMFTKRVGAQSVDLAPECCQLVVGNGELADFGGAHGSEVCRVREQDRPLALDLLVEVLDCSHCGLSFANEHIASSEEVDSITLLPRYMSMAFVSHGKPQQFSQCCLIMTTAK